MAAIPKPDAIESEIYEMAARQFALQFGDQGFLPMESLAHPCDRAVWYEFRQFTPVAPDGRQALAPLIDREFGHLLSFLFTVAGPGGECLSPSILDGYCRGETWSVKGVTSQPHVLVARTAPESYFKTLKSKGAASDPDIYCAAQLYMGAADLSRAVLAVLNRNTCELHVERLDASRDAYAALFQRAHAIITANEAPKRAFGGISFAECKACPFRFPCWQPDAAIQARQSCGTCAALSFRGLAAHCVHQAHPFKLERWGEGCPDWRFLATPREPKQEGDGHPSFRAPALESEQAASRSRVCGGVEMDDVPF